MKLTSVFLAKAFVYFAGLGVLSILAILLPELAREEKASNPEVSSALPYLIGAWVVAIPIFMALYQTLKLIGHVARDEALSAKSITALRNIKFCAIAFGVFFFIATASAFTAAKLASPTEDTAPFGVFVAAFGISSAIIATSAAVLQRLVENAIKIKTENDLTI
jgi:hypothetical protein